MGRYIPLSILLLVLLESYSQNPDASTWRHIDTSIEKKKNLSEIYDLVQELKQEARAGKKYFNVARCYHYEVLIADQRTEDTFYFRNSAAYD